jgi:hypothetical protein
VYRDQREVPGLDSVLREHLRNVTLFPGLRPECDATGLGIDLQRPQEPREDPGHVFAVGVHDAGRVEPAAVLSVRIEADSLGRAGEVGDRGRELDELLEVDADNRGA